MTIADASTIIRAPASSSPSSDIATITDGETTAPEAGVLARGAIVGRYVVLDELGAGAMGRVYSAYDPKLDRRVALKIIRSHPAFAQRPERAQERLLQEAQALAKLAHPNVVAVHDVETHGDGTEHRMVAVAMEYVEGHTLRQWLRERPRGWREVVAVFVAAGRGLAAAHRAGVVHRDFKPDNVMIGLDGRVRVLDFGLARADAPSSESHDAASMGEGATTSSFSGASSQQVETIGIAGTPAYMAPELFAGELADARSDQFAFCVALYEALYGRRPFRGDSLAALSTSVTHGKIDPPDREAGVPARVHRLITRGLQPDPAVRHVDMDALVGELEHDPAAARRRVVVTAAAGTAVVLGVAALASAMRAPDPCSEADEGVAALWNDDRRTEVREALHATGVAWVDELWSQVSTRLDAQADALAAMTRDNCLATHVRGEQSDQLLDLRAACLGHRRRELAAVVDRLAAADREVAQHGLRVLEVLGPVESCADVDALLAAVRPPEDPAVRARADELRARLTEVATLDQAGKYDEALAILQPVRDEAATLRYAPLQAEAALAYGSLLDELGRFAESEAVLAEASWLAEKHHHDEIAARAAVEAVYVVGTGLRRVDDALVWARHADAAVERADHAVMRASLVEYRALALGQAGRHLEAELGLRTSLALREHVLGPEHLDVVASLQNLATAIGDLGRVDEALALHREAYRRYEALLGSQHPLVGEALTNLAVAEAEMGDGKNALAHAKQAVEIFRVALPPDHPHLASALANLTFALWFLDDYVGARATAAERVAMLERSLGPDHPDVAEALAGLGGIDYELQDYAAAREHMTRALALFERTLGPDHPDLATNLNNLGATERRLGNPAAALEHHARGLQLLETHGLTATSDMAMTLRQHALAEIELGRLREGIATYRRALPLFATQTDPAGNLARSQLDIAKALAKLGARTEALAAAKEGLRGCETAEEPEICGELETLVRR